MVRRLPVLILIPLLASAVPAFAARGFSALKDQFTAKIAEDRHVSERDDLVDKVAEANSRSAAEVLVNGLETLGTKVRKNRAEQARVDKELAPLNSDTDVKGDGYRTRNALRARTNALDEIILSDEKVMDRIGQAMSGFTAEEARSEVEKAAIRGKAWQARRFAAAAAAVYPTDAGRTAALKALADKEPRVVAGTLEGLAKRKDAATVPGVVACLSSDAWIVQIGAAQTLAAIGSPKSVRPLIEALGKTSGRVKEEINKALQKLTGQNFDSDYQVWSRWYADHKKQFEGPDAKPLRGHHRKRNPSSDANYYGIQSRSKHVVYVIDISGSMSLRIGGPKGTTPLPGQENRASGPKIEVAKKELERAIRQLPSDACFDVIAFNHLVHVWSKSMVKATQGNKDKVEKFVEGLQASGSTYTYGALKAAFKLAGMGLRDPHYASGVDTIFLLSDGAPTDQSFPTSNLMDPKKILDAVREWNKLSKIVIHAIAIDPKTQGPSFIRFMKELAEENGGQYIERG